MEIGSNVYYLCGMMLPLVGKSLAVGKTAFAVDILDLLGVPWHAAGEQQTERHILA